MNTELLEEEIARIIEEHPNNTFEHLRRVRQLLKHARPGNVPWQILENQYGFDGDWSPADAGEPPYGAKW